MPNHRPYGNLMDYIIWRGDLPVRQIPWTPIDSLLLAVMSYQPFGREASTETGLSLQQLCTQGLSCPRDVPAEKQRIQMITLMASQPRFADMRVFLQESTSDTDISIQFSALSCCVPDGPVVISYRGTDHTLVGWKEDFMMSYLSPVPAQSAALTYLERIASLTDRPLVLTGHSKGGNLAAYAAARAPERIRKRIVQVCSFDGPGLDDETIESQGYAQIRPVLLSVIPNGSVVGLLMNYHPVYTVVTSTTVGLFQHDPLTWELCGAHFHEADETTRSSQLMNETVHTWLKEREPDEIRGFVEILFTTLEKLYLHRGSEDLSDVQLVHMTDAAAYIRTLDPEKRSMIASLLASFFNIGKENYLQIMLQKPVENVLNELQGKLKELTIPRKTGYSASVSSEERNRS